MSQGKVEQPSDLEEWVYKAIRENEPLSVPSILSFLREQQEAETGYTSFPKNEVLKALKSLHNQGHISNTSSVDSEGNVEWRTTRRPDLNPKPDGRNERVEEMQAAKSP